MSAFNGTADVGMWAEMTLMTHSRLFDDPSPSRRRLLANAVAGQNATGAVEFFASILER